MAHTLRHLYRLPMTGLRFFTVYGPWGRPDMALFLFTRNILAGKPIDVFNHGHHRRDFTYVDDIVEGVVRALRPRRPAESGLGRRRARPGDQPRALPALQHRQQQPGRTAALHRGARAVPRPQGGEEPAAAAAGDVPDTWADVDDLARDVGYTPATPVEVGVPRVRRLVSRVLQGRRSAGPESRQPRLIRGTAHASAQRPARMEGPAGACGHRVDPHLRELFAARSIRRFAANSVEALDFVYDYSRQRVTPRTDELAARARRALRSRGPHRRAVRGRGRQPHRAPRGLHMALRNRSGRPMFADGEDVMPAVRAELAKMHAFVTGVHEGRITGSTSGTFTDVVNIGIGGSDLGVVMATEALARFRNRGIRLHCVSNVDGSRTRRHARAGRSRDDAVRRLLQDLHDAGDADQRATRRAPGWRRARRAAVGRHFVAVSTNHAAMDAFGIAPGLALHDVGLGGRPLLALVRGRALDCAGPRHGSVRDGSCRAATRWTSISAATPLERNLPVLMGAARRLERRFPRRSTRSRCCRTTAASHRFPAYLQQLEMESRTARA